MKITSKPNPAAAQAPSPTRIVRFNTTAKHVDPVLAPPAAALEASSAPIAGLEPKSEEAAPEVTQALSPQYTALAKRERALRKLDEEIKQKEAAFKAQTANSISLEDLKKDPFGALNRAGVTYDQLTQQPSVESPESALKAKIEALEARLESSDKRSEERDTESYAQAIKVIESDATLLVNSDPAFETIKAQGKVKEVVSLIEKIYESEGTILDVTEAAKLVEDALVEQSIKQYESLGKLTKVKSKISPPEAGTQQQSESQSTGKTLTNAMGAARQLSARERALLAFHNQLKS